jgi:CHAD domain-containing protein
MNMQEYSRAQTSALLRRLADQVGQAANFAEEDAVHDLRVAIRRLSRCLRVFAQFYPGNSGRKLRGQLRDLMEAAGAVRDIDIAMALLAEAGLPKQSAILLRLTRERRRKGRELVSTVKHWSHRKLRHWGRKLESPL